MQKVKQFKVIENSPPSYLEKYDEFVELYNNKDIKVDKIKAMLGWSANVFDKARKRAVAEGKIINRHPGSHFKKSGGKKSPKYYSFNRNANKYMVKKWLDKGGVRKECYFGLYCSEVAVRRVVEELKKVDWDESELENIQVKVMRELGVSVL